MNSVHSGMGKETMQPGVLNNKDMQRLHKEMTLYGLSEVGMEARRKMIGTEEGMAYHRALAQDQKNKAG